jgi:hypothetical protein
MKQYAASPVIQKLIADRYGYFHTGWQDELYTIVWNVDTALGKGLDIWGRIVVVGRQLQIPQTDYFGFNTGAPQSWAPFDEESFYTGPGDTNTFTLADPAYRVLILTKALSNISAADSMSLNGVLRQLFPGRGRAWVNDLGNMAMRFVFEFPLESWEKAVLVNGNVMPKPAGVLAYLFESPPETFGFGEVSDSLPFDDGIFLSEGAISNVT